MRIKKWAILGGFVFGQKVSNGAFGAKRVYRIPTTPIRHGPVGEARERGTVGMGVLTFFGEGGFAR